MEVALVGTLRELGLDASGDHVRRVFARQLRPAMGTAPAAAQRSQPSALPTEDVEVIADGPLPEPVAF